MLHDVMRSDEAYEHFYEELGRKYPETEIVYSEELGRARQAVVRYYLNRLARRGAHLLDVGSNDGHYSIYYGRLGGTVHGIDISSALVRKAQEGATRLNLKTVTFETANVETFKGGPFEAVLFSEVLEHLRNPSDALRSIADCLLPHGILLLTTPAPLWYDTSLFKLLATRLFSTDLLDRKEHRTDQNAAGRFLEEPFSFRHDEYFPLPLKAWVEGFGFRCRAARTFFFPNRLSWLINGHPLTQSRIPGLNVLGLNNVQLFLRNSRSE